MARTAEEIRAELTEIGAAIAHLVSDRWGRGPRRTRAHWAGADALVVLLEDGHTAAEQVLIAHGHDDEVVRARTLMHEVLEPDMTRIVATTTGRSVLAAMHATNCAPAIAAEVFLLGDRQTTAATAALTRSPSISGGAGRDSP